MGPVHQYHGNVEDHLRIQPCMFHLLIYGPNISEPHLLICQMRTIADQMRIVTGIRNPLLAGTLSFSLCYCGKDRNQSDLQNHWKLHEAHWHPAMRMLVLEIISKERAFQKS